MPRVKKAHQQHTVATFSRHWTQPGVQLQDLGAACKQQALFLCFCGRHYTVKEIAWVNHDSKALTCRDMSCLQHTHDPASFGSGGQYSSELQKEVHLTDAGIRVQSTLERHAMRLVKHVFQGSAIMCEVRLAAGTQMFNKATDIYVAAPFDLMIEVDGAQHFSKPFAGAAIEVQRAVDIEFDQLAAEKKKHLVRLHHRDEPWWGSMLLQARSATQSGYYVSLRTKSYGGNR